uniref:Uncharacterized protein n=1 Tax=Acrobeloides nanus TaxID=290746 RepID=A0A914DNZ4_9BILA
MGTLVMANRYKYSSYVAQFGVCVLSVHGLADIVVIIYFIKPYREFFGKIWGKISMKLYVSPNVSSAEPMTNNVLVSQPQRIQPAVSSVQIYSQIHRNLRRNLQ